MVLSGTYILTLWNLLSCVMMGWVLNCPTLTNRTVVQCEIDSLAQELSSALKNKEANKDQHSDTLCMLSHLSLPGTICYSGHTTDQPLPVLCAEVVPT